MNGTRRAGMLACLLALVAAAPARAQEEADQSAPAPDALAAGPAYYPDAGVSPAIARRLDDLLLAAERRNLAVKVALIATRDDLGRLTDFWGRPEEYAAFLARQLPGYGDESGSRFSLLVVMPSGFGFDHWPEAGRRASRGLELSIDAPPNDVARAAGLVIQRTLRARGRPVAARFADRFGNGARLGARAALGVGGLALITGLAVGGALALRRRRVLPA